MVSDPVATLLAWLLHQISNEDNRIHGDLILRMQVNYQYVLEKCREVAVDGKILDYGCGNGDIVREGREIGLAIVGVEAFYSGSRAREIAATHGLLDVSVFSLSKGLRIPFADETFDLVVSNQVMEHVNDLDFTLSEISRVLKPSGKLLTLFPTTEVIREDHCGIPFVHWFTKDSRLRYPYMRFMRWLGLGYFKKGKSQQQWVLDFMDWLDRYTVYRSYTDIHKLFIKNRFSIKHREVDYVNYRLNAKGIHLPKFIISSTIWSTFASISYRLLGGLVILSSRDSGK